MLSKLDVMKQLGKTDERVYEIMESDLDARNNKYVLLIEYYKIYVSDGYSMEYHVGAGNLNIEGVFTAQRNIWRLIPEWKKKKQEKSEMSQGYKDHYKKNQNWANPIQKELF